MKKELRKVLSACPSRTKQGNSYISVETRDGRRVLVICSPGGVRLFHRLNPKYRGVSLGLMPIVGKYFWFKPLICGK